MCRIQSKRNAFADVLARLLHVFGHPALKALLLTLYAQRHNNTTIVRDIRRVTLWQLFIIYSLKLLLRRPRPHLAHPDHVHGLVWQPGFGLPSGHVMGALVYGNIAVQIINCHWKSFQQLPRLYAALMAWARLYAGVHYPQDVIAGTVIGALIVQHYNTANRILITVHAIADNSDS